MPNSLRSLSISLYSSERKCSLLYSQDQDEVILRPTVSRLVRLGVGPPLEQMTGFYNSLNDNYLLSSSCEAPSREDGSVICSAITQVQVKLY
jgi:hypothetical protein